MGRKLYILDTNVLISDPNAIHAFDDNIVLIPTQVLEELDNHKNDSGDRGYNVRRAIRNLNALKTKGKLNDGVPAGNGGKLFIRNIKPDLKKEDYGLSVQKTDNEILLAIAALKSNPMCLGETVNKTVLVSNDLCMAVKADLLGVEVQVYTHEAVDAKDLEYTGRADVTVSDELFSALCKNGSLTPEETAVFEKRHGEKIHKCEFFLVRHEVTGGTKLAKEKNGVIACLEYENSQPFGITPRNVGQRFCIEALMAPANEIPLVVIHGDAGTAKTFLTLACALQQTYVEHTYREITMTRANVEFDHAIGALPGDETEKVGPLLRGCMDNLETLVDPAYVSGKTKDGSETDVSDKVMELFERGCLSAEALSFLRGRSLKRKILFVDEAQNTTVSQMKGILTRAGEDCKIIVAGCLDQIDTPHLTKRTNGLAYALKLLGGKSGSCAVCTFLENEITRSKLAAEVAAAMRNQKQEGVTAPLTHSTVDTSTDGVRRMQDVMISQLDLRPNTEKVLMQFLLSENLPLTAWSVAHSYGSNLFDPFNEDRGLVKEIVDEMERTFGQSISALHELALDPPERRSNEDEIHLAEILKATPLKDLGLSVRPYNVLKRAFYSRNLPLTAYSIATFSATDLRCIRNMGTHGLREIMEMMWEKFRINLNELPIFSRDLLAHGRSLSIQHQIP
nr:PhoH family protein [Enterocloster bolteae]